MGRRLAIIAPPLAGHYDPLRVLGRELAARGHQPVFFHLAGAAPIVDDANVSFVAIGDSRAPACDLARYRRRLAHADRPAGLLAMIRATAAMTDLLLDTLPGALAKAGIDGVIADATEPAGALVARHLGLPLVTSVTGLPLLRETGVPPPFIGWRYRPDGWGRARNAVGYGIVDRLMAPISRALHRRATSWGLGEDSDRYASLQIAQCPADLDFPRNALPASFRYGAPFRAGTTAPLELSDDGRPLVYCSLGSLQGARPAMFAAMTRACAALGARAVVAHGGGLSEEEARSLPGEPLVRAFWPQPAVLPRCAAAVVHGGFNTVLDALAAGVPMVVMPIAFEQPGTAARVAYHGAGVVVSRRTLLAGRLKDSLGVVLTDRSYRMAAARIGRAIAASGGAAQAAALIEAAIASGERPDASPAAATTASPALDGARDDSRRSGSR
jgi:MGT family glycosyltransferase